MISYFRVVVAVAALLLSGCSTRSLDPYEKQFTLDKEQAIVLVGMDSPLLLGAVRQECSWPCVPHDYFLNGRKDVLAFPVDVGTVFKLDTIRTLDSRVASLRGEELKVERRGVYYYGTITGDYSRVGFRYGADPYFLLAAKRKFGARFDGLEALNFTWPPPADDWKIRFDYPISPSTQTALRSYGRKHLQLTAVAPSPTPLAKCRFIRPVALPEFLPHDEYIRRAFNAELDASQMYGAGPGSIELKGAITEMTYSDGGRAFWQIGLRLDAPNGRSFTVVRAEPFKVAFGAWQACADVADAFPGAVQKLIESVVNAPEFRAVMSAPASTK
jgi:hypothetical protein